MGKLEIENDWQEAIYICEDINRKEKSRFVITRTEKGTSRSASESHRNRGMSSIRESILLEGAFRTTCCKAG